MYKLTLVYTSDVLDHFLQDTFTLAASVQLLASHGIDCVQSSATELLFETERDRSVASLALSASTRYRVVYG